MSEWVGRLKDLSRSLDGSWNISFKVSGHVVPENMAGLQNADLDICVRKHRNRRSLDANAYAWVLINKLAAAMHLDKSEIYRNAIRAIGGVSDTVCVRQDALNALRRGWEAHGIGWQTDTLPSKIPGCINVVLYYGSSIYDSRQMSLLIDHLIQDAKALGIETLPPRELERMLNSWRARA